MASPQHSLSPAYDAVCSAVRNRRTCKILAPVERPVTIPEEIAVYWNEVVQQSIAAAGLAPFHYQRNFQGIAEPWRSCLLDWSSCRKLATKMPEWFTLKPTNKIPSMLSACGSLILVTWIPQFRNAHSEEETLTKEKQVEIDDEHLAASAAFVQNILLLLTAAGLETYWSSGGELGNAKVFQALGMDQQEKLLAAIFIGYPIEEPPETQRIEGKNHSLRSEVSRWARGAGVE